MMIAMHGTGNSVLLHETDGKTVFQTPRRYEVINSSGTLQETGFFAFTHIPVTDEERPVFEHRFPNRVEVIQDRTWICCIPVTSPTQFGHVYCINTMG